MKNLFLTLFFSVAAFACFAQTDYWRDPTVTGINTLLPRTQLISYPSADLALNDYPGSPASMNSLNEAKWNERTLPEGTSFTTQYKVPFEWVDREVFLRIMQADASFSVKINGQQAGYSQESHGGIEFDITKLSKEGNNELEITVYSQPVARALENYAATGAPALPQGICIFSQPRVRIRDVVAEAAYENGGGSLNFGAVIATHLLNEKQVRIQYELRDPAGEVISTGYRDERFGMRTDDTIRFFVRVDGAAPWSHTSPTLYTLLLKMQQEGRYTEYIAPKIGFRTIAYTGDKLNVNGQDVVVRMADFTPSGDPAGDKARIEQLKTQGINTLRLLPHPQNEFFYRMCDGIGIYLCPQADIDTHSAGPSRQREGNPTNDPVWHDAYIARATHMYHTSKLHPSVVMFCLANNSSNGINLYESYRAMKALEKVRPIVYFEAQGEWNTDADRTPDGVIKFRGR